MLTNFLFLLMTCLNLAKGQVIPCQCVVNASYRRACAAALPNADEETCKAAGCCFDARLRRILIVGYAPRCYQATGPCRTFTCDVPSGQRMSCGFRLRYSCERVGCCFDQRSQPSCYNSRPERNFPLSIQTAAAITTTTAFTPSIPTWTEWSAWSSCSASCSVGFRSKRRQCVRGVQIVTNSFCPDQPIIRESCNVDLCRNWSGWEEEGSCSGTCGSQGTINIRRSCIGTGSLGDAACFSSTRSCSNNACVSQRAQWGEWEEWSQCSSECTSGTRSRSRLCVQYSSSVDARLCMGSYLTQLFSFLSFEPKNRQLENCNLHLCSWISSWSPYSACSQTCVTNEGDIVNRLSSRRCFVGASRAPASMEEAEQAIACRARSLPCVGLSRCPTPLILTTPPYRSEASTSVIVASAATGKLPATFTTSSVDISTTQEMQTQSFSGSTPNSPATETSEATSKPSTSPETGRYVQVWSVWSACTRSCGPGVQLRVQVCEDGEGRVNSDSPGCGFDSPFERKRCNTELCPNWGSWSTASCGEDCNKTTENLQTVRKLRSRMCRVAAQKEGGPTCYSQTVTCDLPVECSSAQVNVTSTTATLTTTSSSSWSAWSSWSNCSHDCGSGVRTRERVCDVTRSCVGPATEEEICNVDYCDDWSQWVRSSCSASCGGGERVAERRCNKQMNQGPGRCYKRSEDCGNSACDNDLDILFLVDSSTFVDNCPEIQNGTKGPITSQYISAETTPHYFRMKTFMKEFMKDWRTVGDNKTNVAIQLISDICKVSDGKNLHLVRKFNENHANLTEEINSFPYLCGKFWLDWALRCSESKVITPSSGDRARAPNVIVALLSYVPSWARPGSFLLSALYNAFKRKGITVISASATPTQSLSTNSRKKFGQMLTKLSCGTAENCPKYIGSIWDIDQGSPADRIRNALRDANVI